MPQSKSSSNSPASEEAAISVFKKEQIKVELMTLGVSRQRFLIEWCVAGLFLMIVFFVLDLGVYDIKIITARFFVGYIAFVLVGFYINRIFKSVIDKLAVILSE